MHVPDPLTAAATLATVTPEAAGGARILGWGVVDLPMLICLPVLLVLSGFFSGSETALFGLNESQRMAFRETRSLAGRAIDVLLHDQRMLLITILLGNTTINVLYFVISSVLMIRSQSNPAMQPLIAAAFLLLIVLAGEIGPKLLATAARTQFASVAAPVLLTIHRVIGPMRAFLGHGVIAPLSRLMAPEHPPDRLHDEELRDLLDVSHREGVIAPDEQNILRAVLAMRRLKVRDVMTPRVRMIALPATASRDEVNALMQQVRLTRVPIYDGDLDRVLGMLHIKRYMLDTRATSVTDPMVMTPARFVPELATLDQLLDHLRRTHTQSAIVVDEYGGTEGIVAIEDVVEELVGDIVAAGEIVVDPPRLIGLGTWRVSGEMSVHDFADCFRIELDEPKVATLGGLITDGLGRMPDVGDELDLPPVRLAVDTIEQNRIGSVIVSLLPDAPADPLPVETEEDAP
jgi:CBS domain containing-hemolysin-like protein